MIEIVDQCQRIKIFGKNVLHPNVGFMWEIIDHMWDDPTSLCGMIPHSLIIILGVEISEERNVSNSAMFQEDPKAPW